MTQEQIIEAVEKMTVLELNTLVKAIEEKWGVSAAAVAVAGPAAAAAEEKSSFDVELTAIGEQKIAVIKVVKEALGLGLAEAKTMVESAPVMLKTDVKKEDAEAWKKKIEDAGGKVTLKEPASSVRETTVHAAVVFFCVHDRMRM